MLLSYTRGSSKGKTTNGMTVAVPDLPKAAELSKESVPAAPIELFTQWHDEAITSDLFTNPGAMTLSTATAQGVPSSRIVLLKQFDAQGFVFFTNYNSRKAAELAENPVASLSIYWQHFERQIRIEGRVEKVSKAQSIAYFLSRPAESRIGAWASAQSSILEARDQLKLKFERMQEQFKDGNIPKPEGWGGYRLVPNCIEFWQGRDHRLHDRIRYRKEHSEWHIDRLSP